MHFLSGILVSYAELALLPARYLAHQPCLQAEGEALSRKNGELEAIARKLRAAARDTDQERDRLLTRMAALEGQLAQEQDRASYATEAASRQVGLHARCF